MVVKPGTWENFHRSWPRTLTGWATFGNVAMMGMIEPISNGIVLTIQVRPRASRTECVGVHGDALKFRVAAPPVKGEANAALCAHLAELFSVSQSLVSVLAGQTGRKKRIRIVGVTQSQVCAILPVPVGCSS